MLRGLPCNIEYWGELATKQLFAVCDKFPIKMCQLLIQCDLKRLYLIRLIARYTFVEGELGSLAILMKTLHILDQQRTTLVELLSYGVIFLWLSDLRRMQSFIQLLQDMLLRHLVGVKLEAEGIKADLLKSALHHAESSHLLCDEEHSPPLVQRIGDEVRDRL